MKKEFKLMQDRPSHKPLKTGRNTPQVISITSGKGGVGKTLTTVNLAIAASRLGYKVMILDGDMGLANVDVVLGLQARYNINDVLDGHTNINNIVLDGPFGVKVIPTGSGISHLAQLSYVKRVQLFECLNDLEIDFDLLIVDTGAGIADTVVHLNSIADSSIVVTTPEPHAMTDAYAMIKVLSENDRQDNLNVMVNMAKTEQEAAKVFERLADVSKRFLNRSLTYIGSVPMDPQVQLAVSMRRVASESSIHTIAGQAWNQISRDILMPAVKRNRTQQEVWRELIWAQQTTQIGLEI